MVTYHFANNPSSMLPFLYYILTFVFCFFYGLIISLFHIYTYVNIFTSLFSYLLALICCLRLSAYFCSHNSFSVYLLYNLYPSELHYLSLPFYPLVLWRLYCIKVLLLLRSKEISKGSSFSPNNSDFLCYYLYLFLSFLNHSIL